jgi:hypothetical protein
MSKPIAKVTILATGPTHYLGLPVAGQTSFIPGGSFLVYDAADLEMIKRAIPSSQLRVREFPRSLDEQEGNVVTAAVVTPKAPKGTRGK